MYNEREYIKVYRKIINWGWYKNPATKDIYLHLLFIANWKPGEWEGYSYDRGQVITSLQSLANETGWSVRNVRTALKHLKSTGEIKEDVDNKVRIITLVNYEKYQNSDKQSDKASDKQSDRQSVAKNQGKSGTGDKASDKVSDKVSDRQVTSNRQASDRQVTTEEEYKEYKNNKNSKKQLDIVSYTPQAARSESLNQDDDDEGWYSNPGEPGSEWLEEYKRKGHL